MGLNIKNPEVNQLIEEVAAATGESKTEAVRQAMLDRKQKLALPPADERWKAIKEKMDREFWPLIPPELRGKTVTQEEQDEILGYGPDGFCV